MSSGSLTGTHALTLAMDGNLTGWELPRMLPVFSMANLSMPTISPGGKYVAASTGTGLCVIEISTGMLVGLVPDLGLVKCANWNPAGTRIALVTSEGDNRILSILDVTTGGMSSSIPLLFTYRTVKWCSDRYLLLDDSKLIDIDQQGVAWTYTLNTSFPVPHSQSTDAIFLCQGGPAGRIQVQSLPAPREEATLTEFACKRAVVLNPGDTCAVGYRLTHPAHDPTTQAAIRREIEGLLAQKKIRIDPKAKVTITLTSSETTTGTASETVQRFRDFKEETVTYTKKRGDFSIAIEVEGHTLWSRPTTTGTGLGFGHFQLKPGETVGQYIEELYLSNSKRAFNSITIPSRVKYPEAINGAGTTDIRAFEP